MQAAKRIAPADRTDAVGCRLPLPPTALRLRVVARVGAALAPEAAAVVEDVAGGTQHSCLHS